MHIGMQARFLTSKMAESLLEPKLKPLGFISSELCIIQTTVNYCKNIV